VYPVPQTADFAANSGRQAAVGSRTYPALSVARNEVAAYAHPIAGPNAFTGLKSAV